MALTHDFKETVLARIQAEPRYGDALLNEGIECMLAGDLGTGKAMLRDCIKATSSFAKLGAETGSSSKSLMRCSAQASIRRRETYRIDEASCNSLPRHD